jgi:hypothetical protein
LIPVIAGILGGAAHVDDWVMANKSLLEHRQSLLGWEGRNSPAVEQKQILGRVYQSKDTPRDTLTAHVTWIRRRGASVISTQRDGYRVRSDDLQGAFLAINLSNMCHCGD